MMFFYSDTFDIPLPRKHRFPGSKYSQLRAKLIEDGVLNKEQLIESPLASKKDIEIAHCEHYVNDFLTGSIDLKKMKRIGFPWSEHLVKRIRATIGGAVASAEAALEYGLSGQLAGGTHHAHYDYGGGYCIFNDFAVAALKLIKEKKVSKVAIVDLDVHQGDGNASLLKSNENVFVLSLHGEKNYPFKKFPSDLDVPLPDECSDELFLEKLSESLEVVRAFEPELILYQAGVDTLVYDRLGRLNLSYEGLKKRDEMVFGFFKNLKIPLSMAIGGGYSEPIEQSVRAYVQTYQVAKQVYKF